MAVNWKVRAHALEEEAQRTGRVILRAPALERWAQLCIRFLLSAVLGAGEILGGFSPFAVGMVAGAGAGMDGLCALLGACFGYVVFQGFAQGVRYAAACVLTFSVAFAFYDVKLCRQVWFMPLVCAVMDGLTGFVYLSDTAWRASQVAFFFTEVLLAGLSAYLYRVAFAAWRAGEGVQRTARQIGALIYLLGSTLVALAGITFLRDLSLGRTAAIVLVMAAAYAGGPGVGAAAGVAAGVGMDLAAGMAPFYTMAYGFSGLLTGAGWRQGRLFAALTYVVSNAAAVLWTWEGDPRVSSLYEVFVASVVFFLLPPKWLRSLSVRLTGRRGEDTARRAAEYVSARLRATAGGFRQVCDSLRRTLAPKQSNDADASAVFDRAAQRVCVRCALRSACWERDYVSTFDALNNALPALLERGRGEAGDFPGWFSGRCLQFPAFLKTVNEELVALMYRREYRSRVEENRGAVCRQYEALTDVLEAAAAELSTELVPDPQREKKLRTHLAALDVEGEPAVWYDAAGRLRAEVTGRDLAPLRAEGEAERLSALMGMPLRRTEEGEGKVVYCQAEPLLAVAGLAAQRREGQSESGDSGTWFKRSDGSLFVLLCDGMGSGQAAHQESALAVRLLEGFLRAGIASEAALRTVNSALALKNQETGAFTTVDLLRLDLFTGQGEMCKYGAAPSYLRRDGTVSRITGNALPAGLADGDRQGPDVTGLALAPGDCVLLLSDGVADSQDDSWVRQALEAFDGKSPKDLARTVMEESEKRVGRGDDRTVVVIKLERR